MRENNKSCKGTLFIAGKPIGVMFEGIQSEIKITQAQKPLYKFPKHITINGTGCFHFGESRRVKHLLHHKKKRIRKKNKHRMLRILRKKYRNILKICNERNTK